MVASATVTMSRFRMHKLGLPKSLTDPAKDSVEDASLHAERPQQAEFILIERNASYPALVDESAMAMHLHAADALQAGDIDSALAYSAEVKSRHPTYWFNHRIFLEAAALSADTDRRALMAQTFETIRGLEAQRLGLMPEDRWALTAKEVPAEALAFEESRHWFNLGDDYESLYTETGDATLLERAAACFRQSRALLDPVARPEMVVARQLREALVRHTLKQPNEARRLIAEATGANSAYVVSFVRARPYMKPLLNYLKERSNLP
jgi:hypothetical protein